MHVLLLSHAYVSYSFLSSTTFILRLQVSVSMVSNHLQEPGNEARTLLDFTQQDFIQDCFVGRGNVDV